MSEVLAVIEGVSTESPVFHVAKALGDVIHGTVRTLCVTDLSAEESQTQALEALAEDSVALGVLAAEQSASAVCWQVISQASKPVVLVPPRVRVARAAIGRVLVPLDGTPESSAAISGTVSQLARAGVDIVVLHVFDAATAPRFWDQAAYAPRDWAEEFLSRHVSAQNARLEIRTGTPGEQVVDVAEAENADLIALGWSQQLDENRARTVRRSVLESAVPVLLVPLLDG